MKKNKAEPAVVYMHWRLNKEVNEEMKARTSEELYTLTEARQIICAEQECKKEKTTQKILGLGLVAVGIAAAPLTGDGSATIVLVPAGIGLFMTKVNVFKLR